MIDFFQSVFYSYVRHLEATVCMGPITSQTPNPYASSEDVIQTLPL